MKKGSLRTIHVYIYLLNYKTLQVYSKNNLPSGIGCTLIFLGERQSHLRVLKFLFQPRYPSFLDVYSPLQAISTSQISNLSRSVFPDFRFKIFLLWQCIKINSVPLNPIVLRCRVRLKVHCKLQWYP